MKKPLVIIIVLVVLGLVWWSVTGTKSSNPSTNPNPTASPVESTVSAPVSETTKVSDKLSEFKNEELGFSVKYPSLWEKAAVDNGLSFTIPTGKTDSNTIGKLDTKITVLSGKCAFPPVTTIKDRGTLKSGDLNFNMISMSNSVQGRAYFDRMYSLQRDNICYMFSFSSITLSPASKGFKGSEATQMSNNNKALVESADTAFTAMVKSFAYVVGAVGQDETVASPKK